MKKSLMLVSVLFLTACSLPYDKKLHVGAGAIAYGVQAVVLPNKLNSTVAERCALATVAGAAKEGRDSLGYGNVELADFGATVAGCLVADAAVQLTKKVVTKVQTKN